MHVFFNSTLARGTLDTTNIEELAGDGGIKTLCEGFAGGEPVRKHIPVESMGRNVTNVAILVLSFPGNRMIRINTSVCLGIDARISCEIVSVWIVCKTGLIVVEGVSVEKHELVAGGQSRNNFGDNSRALHALSPVQSESPTKNLWTWPP